MKASQFFSQLIENLNSNLPPESSHKVAFAMGQHGSSTLPANFVYLIPYAFKTIKTLRSMGAGYKPALRFAVAACFDREHAMEGLDSLFVVNGMIQSEVILKDLVAHGIQCILDELPHQEVAEITGYVGWAGVPAFTMEVTGLTG